MIQAIIIFIVITASVFYVGYRLWKLIPSKKASRILLIIFAVFEIGGFLFLKISGYKLLPYPVVSFIYNSLPVWFYISIYLAIIFIILDLLRLLGVRIIKKYLFSSWTGLAYLSALLAILLIGGYINYLNVKKEYLPITLSKHTIDVKPLIKIVVIGDLNIGYGTGGKEVKKWISLINKEEPDVVLITGDIFDYGLNQLYTDNIAHIFNQIESKYGTYAVMGNQEFLIDRFDSQKFNQFIKDSQIKLLRDSVVLIDNSFYIIGRKDNLYKFRKPLSELIKPLDKSKPLILLDHQPVSFDEAVENGIDLQISGSIGIGQVWPLSLYVKSLFENPYGYSIRENTHFYVTSGIGINSGKFRFGSQSEYLVIQLQ